jgi:hypothetical protein
MAESCSKTGGRRRRHTKKHKRHSRRRLRGGTTLPSISGVETFPGGHVDVRSGVNMSGEKFETPGYNGGRRRSRKTRRRHRRRSMRGGTGGEGIGYGFGGPLTDSGVGAAQRAYVGASTGNHTVDANGYNGGHP